MSCVQRPRAVAHPEFRTVVEVVGDVRVTGVLPGAAWRPEGLISISGDVQWLWRDQARELAVALVLVADRMDACADERYGAVGAGAPTGEG